MWADNDRPMWPQASPRTAAGSPAKNSSDIKGMELALTHGTNKTKHQHIIPIRSALNARNLPHMRVNL